MKKSEIIQASIDMITEYYRNNLEPFFNFVADDVLWIGPRGGQVLVGRESLIRTWTSEQDHQLRFSMGNIEVLTATTGRGNLEVLLEYYVHTHFPDGNVDTHHQRLHYSWGNRQIEENGETKTVPKICMLHISNVSADVKKIGKVYPKTASDSHRDAIRTKLSRVGFRTVCGQGMNEESYYFNSSTILWIESADNSKHSLIHTSEGTFKAREPLRYFEEQLSGTLVRVHMSYLINPLYLRSVRRFEVELTDGTVLSIPEKKYTMVRQKLQEWKPDAS